MQAIRLYVPTLAKRFRWPVLVGVGVATGCLPYTVSGVLEFLVIAVVPGCLGFLIARWWAGAPRQIALAVALPLFGSLVRLLVTSINDGSNWFSRLFRAVDAVGLSDPYVRQGLLTLLFPVFVTILATVIFMFFQRGEHA